MLAIEMVRLIDALLKNNNASIKEELITCVSDILIKYNMVLFGNFGYDNTVMVFKDLKGGIRLTLRDFLFIVRGVILINRDKIKDLYYFDNVLEFISKETYKVVKTRSFNLICIE